MTHPAVRSSLNITIIMETPPDPATGLFGLQDRDQAVHTGQAHGTGVQLRASITVIDRPEGLDFTGAFVHGPRGDRFMYLALRGANGAWVRRMKVGLHGITRDLLMQAGVTGLVATIDRLNRARAVLATSDWRMAEEPV